MKRIQNKYLLDYWVQYLIHINNIGIGIQIGFLSAMLILMSIFYSTSLELNIKLGLLFNAIFLLILMSWINFSKTSKAKRASDLLHDILKGKITNIDEIRNRYYQQKFDIPFFSISIIFLIISGLIFFTEDPIKTTYIIFFIYGILFLYITLNPILKKNKKR